MLIDSMYFKPYLPIAMVLGMCVLVLISSCSKDDLPEPSLDNMLIYSGDIHITDSLATEEGQGVYIKPGTRITFGPEGMLVVNGDLIAVGTPDSLIEFVGDNDTPDQLILRVRWDATLFELRHASIRDGLVRSKARDNHLQYVQFYNTKHLKWNSALIRLWYGRMTIEDCEAYGNNTGEGILAHNMTEPIVRRSTFEKVPDAVEYIDSHHGAISDNTFIDNGDDGIDQNSCIGTTIENNEFYGVLDRAMELGSENFGSSKSLIVRNNLIINCNVGINVKESSEAFITNTTFYANNVAVEAQTPADSSIATLVTIDRSIFVDNPTPMLVDDRSHASVSNSVSDLIPLAGENNLTAEVDVTMGESGDIQVDCAAYPEGYDETTIGYQK